MNEPTPKQPTTLEEHIATILRLNAEIGALVKVPGVRPTIPKGDPLA